MNFEFKQVYVQSNPDIVAKKTDPVAKKRKAERGVYRPNLDTPRLMTRRCVDIMIDEYLMDIMRVAEEKGYGSEGR